MATSDAVQKKPFWLLIEEKILELDAQALYGENKEATIHRIAGELDETGYLVSNLGGNMLLLRWAIGDMLEVGRPLLKDLNDAIAALTLEDVAEPYAAADRLIQDIGKTWPDLKKSERRAEVIRSVQKTRLDLLVAKAKGMPGDEGIRFLIEAKVAPEVITGEMEITGEKLEQVNADIKKERAERARVATLLEKVNGRRTKQDFRGKSKKPFGEQRL